MELYKYNELTNDLNFKKKLELSYQHCLKELTNPENWEKKIQETKYTIDPQTGYMKTYIEFLLNKEDNIYIDDIDHTYIFKRSHFYKKSNLLRKEIEQVWNKRGYYVSLKEINNIWILKISWKY